MINISINSINIIQTQALSGGNGKTEGSNKLGFYEIALLFLGLSIGGLVTPVLITPLGGPRICMALGGFSQFLFLLFSILPA